MAYDEKFGTITLEKGSVGDDEPVFLLRAADALAVQTIEHYAELCSARDCQSAHIAGVMNSRQRVVEWQDAHAEKVHLPD